MNAALCRRLLGPDKILGVSAQTPEQAIQAEKERCRLSGNRSSLSYNVCMGVRNEL